MKELSSFTREGLYLLNTLCDLSERQIHELSVGHMMSDWEVRPVIDRTGYFHSWIRAKKYPLPDINHDMNADIDLYMDLVAQEYINKYNEIFVIWSGGIDSTAVLSALLKNRKRRDQIKVIISESSVHEYPWFYHTYKDEVEWLYMNPDYPANYYMHALFRDRDHDNYIILTGVGGDQLFTLVRLNNHQALHPDWSTDIYTENWQDLILDTKWGIFEEPKSCTLYSPEQRQIFVDLLEEHMDHTGIYVKDAFHGFWYMVFMFSVFKVEGSLMDSLRTRMDDYTLNIESFFGHDLIEQWCMHAHINDLLPRNVGKFPLKDYIYDFTGDQYYRDCKQKWASIHPLKGPRNKFSNLFGFENTVIPDVTGPDKLEELYQFLDEDKVKLKDIQDIEIPVTFCLELEGTLGTNDYPNIEILLDNKPVWAGQIIGKQRVTFDQDLSLCQDSFNISIKCPGNNSGSYVFDDDGLPTNATLLHVKLIYITDNDVKQKFIPNIYSLDLNQSRFLVQESTSDDGIGEDGLTYMYNSVGYKGVWQIDFRHSFWSEYTKNEKSIYTMNEISDIRDFPDLDFSFEYQYPGSIHSSLRPRKTFEPNNIIQNSNSAIIDDVIETIYDDYWYRRIESKNPGEFNDDGSPTKEYEDASRSVATLADRLFDLPQK